MANEMTADQAEVMLEAMRGFWRADKAAGRDDACRGWEALAAELKAKQDEAIAQAEYEDEMAANFDEEKEYEKMLDYKAWLRDGQDYYR